MMRVGYARVSTTEQSIEAQLERLANCERIFSEKLSGSKMDRPELARALEFVREGDVLVATRLDRLARSVAHLCQIADTLRHKQVELVILDQAIDTSTPAGKFLFHMLAAVAEFELTIRLEASRAGMAHARAMGKHCGRPYKVDASLREHIADLQDEGLGATAIARRVRLDRSTVYRVLASLRDGPEPASNTTTTPIAV